MYLSRKKHDFFSENPCVGIDRGKRAAKVFESGCFNEQLIPMPTPSSSHRFREEKADSMESNDSIESIESKCLDRQVSPAPHQSHQSHQSQRSPVVRLLRITEQGLVFESWRSFEVGIFIDFGMHVPGRPATPREDDHKPSFLNLEGFVVDSQADCQSASRNASYRVTVMFSDLDSTDRALLRELEACVRPQPAVPASATSMSPREMFMAQLEEVFGLN